MVRTISVAVMACLLCPVLATGQARIEQGSRRSGEPERRQPAPAQTTPGRPVQQTVDLQRQPAPTSRTPVQPKRTAEFNPSPFHGPEMGGPITQAVDFPQPTFIPVPVVYYPSTDYVIAAPVDYPYEPPAAQRRRTIFATTLGSCIDDPSHAGFSFASRSIVSCEDSTVDFYLSYADSGTFALIVPHDTDIKDAGYHMHVLDVVVFKPIDWAPEHMVRVEGGHVYIVWTNAGEFYLVRVNSLEKGRAAIEWARHSRLPREEVERHQKTEEMPPPAPEPPRERGRIFPR